MAYKSEIMRAIKTVKKFNKRGVAVLKCTSIYPAENKDLNLNAILEYKKQQKNPLNIYIQKKYFDSNVVGTQNIATASIKYGVKKIIYSAKKM